MKRKIVSGIMLTLLLIGILTSSFNIQAVTAVDWWLMFHHDPGHTGFSSSTSPNTNATLWRCAINSPVYYSSPAVIDGRVFFGSGDGRLYVLDAATGAHLWNYTTGDWVYSSSAVADGKVYFGSWDGQVYALNVSTGELIWSYSIGVPILSSPTIAYGKVYIGTHALPEGYPYTFNFYALNDTSGTLVWNFTAGGVVFSSPAVANGRVFITSIEMWGMLYSLDASTGALLWNFSLPWGDYAISSPSVADDRVFFGDWDHKVYALVASTGEFLWSYQTKDLMVDCPAVANGKVFVSAGNRIYVLNTTNGAPLWISNSIGPSYLAVANGKVFVAANGIIYAFDEDTGTQIWAYADLYTGGTISYPAVADGKVFVGSERLVYCFGQASVGGIYIPVNKLQLLAPYIGLTILLAVAVMTVGYVKKRKRNTEIIS